jgi:hypothetical protein
MALLAGGSGALCVDVLPMECLGLTGSDRRFD